jgi:hypothetical protein
LLAPAILEAQRADNPQIAGVKAHDPMTLVQASTVTRECPSQWERRYQPQRRHPVLIGHEDHHRAPLIAIGPASGPAPRCLACLAWCSAMSCAAAGGLRRMTSITAQTHATLDGVIDAPPADALFPYMSDAGRQGALDLALAADALLLPRETWQGLARAWRDQTGPMAERLNADACGRHGRGARDRRGDDQPPTGHIGLQLEPRHVLGRHRFEPDGLPDPARSGVMDAERPGRELLTDRLAGGPDRVDV